MRKKFMLVAALAGILSLGACVDDKESASVEAIRNAKAEQLKAMAVLYKAQAEAEVIYANAEKAYKEAEAEHLKSLANINNQDVVKAKEELDQAKQEFAIRLEQIKAEAEAAMLRAKLEAASNELALLARADEELQRLYGNYANGISELNSLNQELLGYKLDVAGLEAGVVSAEAYVKQQTLSLNNSIANETARKAALEALDANDRDALAKQMEALAVQKTEAGNASYVASVESSKASVIYNTARAKFDLYSSNPLATVKAANSLRNLGYNNILLETKNKLVDDYYSTTQDVITYTLNQSEVLTAKKDLDAIVTTYKVSVIGARKAGTVAATGLYATLETKEKDLEDAEADLAEAIKDKKSQAIIEGLELNVVDAKIAVAKAEEAIEKAKVTLKSYEQRITDFDALVAAFSGNDLKAYNDALTELKSLAVAKEKAAKAASEASAKSTLASTLYNDVSNIYNALTDIATEIASCETNIADYQEQIANLTNVANAEMLLAAAKDNIAKTESLIAAQKIIVEKAKAALNAALAAA